MKDNFIPVFQSIYSVYANDEEMLKGNLKYYKFKVLAINTYNYEFIELCRDGHEVVTPNDEDSFIGLYEESELDTEDFIADLEVYYNKLD